MSQPFLYIPVGVDHLLRDKIQIVPRNQAIVCYLIVYSHRGKINANRTLGCPSLVQHLNENSPLGLYICMLSPQLVGYQEGLGDVALLDWVWLLCH